jgi:hypothetical protein
MLTYSLASAALMQTGCKSNTTTVVVVNKTGAKVSIVASASAQGKTYKFNKKNIANGKSAKQKYVTKLNKGSKVNFVVSSLKIGNTNVPPNQIPNLSVVVGKTNTFTIDKNGNVTAKVS